MTLPRTTGFSLSSRRSRPSGFDILRDSLMSLPMRRVFAQARKEITLVLPRTTGFSLSSGRSRPSGFEILRDSLEAVAQGVRR